MIKITRTLAWMTFALGFFNFCHGQDCKDSIEVKTATFIFPLTGTSNCTTRQKAHMPRLGNQIFIK